MTAMTNSTINPTGFGFNSKYRPLWVGGISLILLPFLMILCGQTLSTAATVVLLSIAAMGLNVLIGYTGLVSFGHSVWFGVGAYAAALAQLNWMPGQIILPAIFAVVFVMIVAAVVGAIILRRRGVYFALMTLALAALTYTITFRWTALTGGEDGLGGLERGHVLGMSLDSSLSYYVFSAIVGFGVLILLFRIFRSPFGHVLMAIRENEQRADFQGYSIYKYKLAAFVLSASITALAGALSGFQHHIVSAQATSVIFAGELMAMVVIGGMRNLLGPAIGVLFFILFREMFSIWTNNWLFWFGLVFVSFVMFSPKGIAGIWGKIKRRLNPPPELNAAMSNRKIYQGLDLPGFLKLGEKRNPVLDVNSVSINFGGIKAVTSAGLTVNTGEIHGLIGPNGAGKTTFFNIVSGMYTPTEGSVSLYGKEIHKLAPSQICQLGLARSFQITNLFNELTIFENLRLSMQAGYSARNNPWADIDQYNEINEQTWELIKFLGLEGIENILAGDLSYGGQRLVDLGIALASRPKMLLLDEPLAGLAAAERERVSNLIIRIAENIPVLIVEHDIDRLLGFSHRVTVMNQGEVLMTGLPEEIRADKRVQEIYTGSGTPVVTGRTEAAEGSDAATVLDFIGVNSYYGKSHILNDATFTVKEGEIVALLGRNGAGKSTLLKSLAGIVQPASGSIKFCGEELVGMPAYKIARMGVGYVPQGRGIFAGMTVADNLELGRLTRKVGVQEGSFWTEEKIFEFFPRLKERINTPADYLSGGEQQMLAIARALSRNVRLLLLDEPFEGLAPAVIEELFVVLDKLRKELPIIIVEHNLDLVLALADRVFALEQGAVFHEGPAEALLEDLDYRKQILWL